MYKSQILHYVYKQTDYNKLIMCLPQVTLITRGAGNSSLIYLCRLQVPENLARYVSPSAIN